MGCAWFALTLIILNNFNVKKALSTSLNNICKNLLGLFLFFFFIIIRLIVIFFIRAQLRKLKYLYQIKLNIYS
ncbi:conserved hypothetical protein [Xenorhabdus nematophila F1]|uniref:Uncharacterized protein n=1 Tax=Xenorhabdus nematophila (strain ATCC 19061 / DSM 3370 / CCUG 14189 / LMG 1036 / NCIMB 9965 / AN6) TaxID=406817 RepID=D3VBH7_XENNA|nr:hypothetical protein XNC1_1553 [Xenorhabdus nematophila ATCC 19061]CCW29529.1 conserved hypothetical protein [Xenorhabdus nematophila F1]CEK22504.1 hypothetical protein XNC2_1510 [Xenorhabdus nematophila AN6/1]